MAQFILLATNEERGCRYIWGWRGLNEEGWVAADNIGSNTRSAGSNPYKRIRLMSSEEACLLRDTARRYNLSDLNFVVAPVGTEYNVT